MFDASLYVLVNLSLLTAVVALCCWVGYHAWHSVLSHLYSNPFVLAVSGMLLANLAMSLALFFSLLFDDSVLAGKDGHGWDAFCDWLFDNGQVRASPSFRRSIQALRGGILLGISDHLGWWWW